MSKVDVGGVSLYYEETGSGQPVVFVHGIPTDCRAWGAQVEPFSKGRKMLAVSRRYAAPNVREGDVSDSTVQNNASDLKGFIEKAGGGPVDLVGHSYGGFISAFLAADHPDLVRNLVLVEAAISTLLVADQTSSAQSLGLLFRSPSVALSGRRFQTKSLGPSLKALDGGQVEKAVELNVDGVQDSMGAFRRLSEGARKMMLDNARTIAELRTTFPRFTATEAGRISAPTMVVNGQDSALWLRRIGELTAKAIPKARRVTVPGARHFPHMENPEVFNSNVLDFLEGKGKQ
ncbi:MAG TPA: alpha/beta hydrolase [Nitrososphaerales archaeon]